MRSAFLKHRRWIGSAALVGTVLFVGGALSAWKSESLKAADAAASHQPEPMESVTVAVARERSHRETTTSIGTVLALRSITLRNEVAGVIASVSLRPGRVVDAGEILVALDVSVEAAELEALRAQAALAQTTFDRLERLRADGAASQEEVDQARAQRDVAAAQIARSEAVIARKTIRAPFRALVGISDVHPGQYIDAGTLLTTLQGVSDTAHVDFAVSQEVASALRAGMTVQVTANGGPAQPATIVAIDALIDPVTRNAMVRARTGGGGHVAPGASVRVEVPAGPATTAVVVPATALRKGPAGDHVFVVAEDAAGHTRAHMRPVLAGSMIDDEVVIVEGLATGERVAALGSFKLFESILVSIKDGAMPAAGGAQ